MLREMGREILEAVLNRLEVSSHADWPTHVRHEGETYRRRAEATPHEIRRCWSGDAAAAGIPLGCGRGAVAVSPGRSAGFEARLHARPGRTGGVSCRPGRSHERTLLDLLKRDHGVTMGVGRLRQLLSEPV